MARENVIKIITFVFIAFLSLTILYKINIVKKSPNSDCIIISENEAPFDVVFLSYKYNNKENFIKTVNNYITGKNGFNNIEPFKTNSNKFNFYAVFTDSVLCSIEDGTLICDELSTKKSASKCPNDYIFVLADRSYIIDILSPVRSSSYLNIASINTADHELVMLHEFAHTFGRLVDEYVDEVSYKDLLLKNAPNCDVGSCIKWKDFNDTQCLKGCALNKYHRSKDYTIMRNYFKSNTFGEYDEWLLNQSLYQ